ncbi:MAG: cytochrome c [Candidatus Polarisedimenticolaceae bacterium]|nr:cytochrome c [Candidatus Polarisedimenticolaceae bacterium]
MMLKTLFLLLLTYTLSTASADQSNQKRWYSTEQVTQGEQLFAKFCAECHGERAASTTEWRKQNAEGYYPPPPLNGSAHTWHHSLPLLQRTIQEGGAKFGGQMPPFADKLNAAEIDAIIAWFQSLWPDKTYASWSGRGISKVPQPDFMKNLPR